MRDLKIHKFQAKTGQGSKSNEEKRKYEIVGFFSSCSVSIWNFEILSFFSSRLQKN